MIYPRCLSSKTQVNKTLKTTNTNERYRQCLECKYTFVTIEAIKMPKYWQEYEQYIFDTNADIDKEKR